MNYKIKSRQSTDAQRVYLLDKNVFNSKYWALNTLYNNTRTSIDPMNVKWILTIDFIVIFLRYILRYM